MDFQKKRIRLWMRKREGGREQDWITMTSELQGDLEKWYKNRTFPDSDFVFLCEETNTYCKDIYGHPFQFHRHWLPKLCGKAEVEVFGFHAIRHLSASILDYAGYPITVIQTLLRHKSANTTARYLHKLRGSVKLSMRDLIEKADQLLHRETLVGHF